MSSSIKCPICLNTFNTKSGYAQHKKFYCTSPIKSRPVESSSEESSFVFSTNEMLLDCEEISHDIEQVRNL
jgi:hypothetical protein